MEREYATENTQERQRLRTLVARWSDQGLRSPSEPLQRWQHNRTTSAAELALEFVNAEAPFMTFPFQHTKCDDTTADMMLLGPRRVVS
jgi:hypothetical protein